MPKSTWLHGGGLAPLAPDKLRPWERSKIFSGVTPPDPR